MVSGSDCPAGRVPQSQSLNGRKLSLTARAARVSKSALYAAWDLERLHFKGGAPMWDDLEEEETAVGPLRLGPVEVDDAEMNGVQPGEVNQRVAKALEKEHGVCVREEEGEVFGVPVMKTEERNALRTAC